MQAFSFKDKVYELDESGFLINPDEWDEDFAIGMAPQLGINSGLSAAHWAVIVFIRDAFQKTGKCPYVFETCKGTELTTKELRNLFPSGYLRGACLLAGITYKHRIKTCLEKSVHKFIRHKPNIITPEQKIYQIDTDGFLVHFSEWDRQYAVNKAMEMKMPEGLTDRHWQIINYLREKFQAEKAVPTVFQCCEDNHMEMDDLAVLFPDGYHRGAVKIAGLRVI